VHPEVGGSVNIIIPKLGLTMESAELTKWLVEDGASIVVDQPIAEIATDKVEHEIVAPGSGTLRQVAEEGQELPIGSIIGEIHDVTS
jgi:pyruvate/2-oxoglutarate dehydrogenase complex dihydrolipoamide acyltransferase (E2) component